MKNSKKTVELVGRAIAGIDEALLRHRKDVSSSTAVNQLVIFKRSLLHILNMIASGNIPHNSNRELGLARVIVDQWTENLELGLLIIDAEQAYKNL